jgi:ribosomal protein L37AE/L43A
MMRKKYSLRQRVVMAIRAIRDINEMATCWVSCPACGSSNVSGNGPWTCNKCNMMWQ